MENIIRHESGIANVVKAKTLTSAKREATNQATFGGGSVVLFFDGEIWVRKFWNQLRSYGWDNWVKVN